MCALGQGYPTTRFGKPSPSIDLSGAAALGTLCWNAPAPLATPRGGLLAGFVKALGRELPKCSAVAVTSDASLVEALGQLASELGGERLVSSGLLVGFRVVNDGEAYSDVAAVPIEVESVKDQPKANEESVKVQEDAPVTVKAQEDKPVAVKPQEAAPLAVKVQEEAPLAVKVPAKGSVTTDTDSTLIYASGNVYDILDQAAVDARNDKVEQAQVALSSLLKDKDATVMAGYELGLIHYESGEVDKAMPFFKNALSAAFGGPASGKDEQALTALLNQEADADRIRYELGLICQSQGKQDQAAKLFSDGLGIISAQNATYSGVKKCKSCHFKQWNSWRKTKMATTFEVLKPGVRSEEKSKLKFDPNKDYTKDATCLGCHTSGFGIPGGYVVPADGDAEAKTGRSGNRRASNKGYLPIGFEDYLRILDWTGRQVRSDKRGAIPPELRPILERLGVCGESWVDCVQNFGRWFHRAAGRATRLAGAAARAGRQWFHGVSRCRQAFA